MNDTLSNIPHHVAVIMDGNRRWARFHKLPILEGHRKVADDILEPLIEHAANRGIQYLTFWAWSTENWGRGAGEVRGIMQLFRYVIKKRWQRLHKKGIRIRVIGDIDKFPKDIAVSLKDVVEQTKDNKKITAIFALNYGGRDEILRAIQRLYEDEKSQIKNPPAGEAGRKLNEEQFSQYLDTSGIPDPELIVRTGGEQRLSGFLLWQSEYSELAFVDWYMPDFTSERLDEIIAHYQTRQRRFGK